MDCCISYVLVLYRLLTTHYVVSIEYQNEFTTEGGKLYGAVKECMEATGTLENSRKVMDAARDAGCTIIHCPISFEKVRIRFNNHEKDPHLGC